MKKGQKRAKGMLGERMERARLTPEESLQRLLDSAKRKEQFVTAVRKPKNRGTSS